MVIVRDLPLVVKVAGPFSSQPSTFCSSLISSHAILVTDTPAMSTFCVLLEDADTTMSLHPALRVHLSPAIEILALGEVDVPVNSAGKVAFPVGLAVAVVLAGFVVFVVVAPVLLGVVPDAAGSEVAEAGCVLFLTLVADGLAAVVVVAADWSADWEDEPCEHPAHIKATTQKPQVAREISMLHVNAAVVRGQGPVLLSLSSKRVPT